MKHLVKAIIILCLVVFISSCSSQFASLPISGNVNIMPMRFSPGSKSNMLYLAFIGVKRNKEIFLNNYFIKNSDRQGNAKYTAYFEPLGNLTIQLRDNTDRVLDSKSFQLQDVESKEINIECVGRVMECTIRYG